MKIVNKLLWMLPCATVWVACTEQNTVEFSPSTVISKTETIAEDEFLASYDVLSSYINTATTPNLKLGAVISLDDLVAQGKAYAQIKTNFSEVTPDSVMLYGYTTSDDGDMTFTDTEHFVRYAQEAGVSVCGNSLCWYAGQNVTRLDTLIADIQRTGVVTEDFEGYTDNYAFDMNGSDSQSTESIPSATVVTVDGSKVIHVKDAIKKWFPQFTFQLPTVDGYAVTFGDCDSLEFDYKNDNSNCGEQGLRVMFGSTWPGWVFGANNSMTQTDDFGAANDGTWYRNAIRIPIHKLYNFTDAQKALNKVTPLGVGVDLNRNCDYYMDNFELYWSLEPRAQTAEEKVDTLSTEFRTWSTALMEACDGGVASWDIVTDPLVTRSDIASTDTTEYFFWEEAMGENYVVNLARIAREVAGDTQLQLYVNNLFDISTATDVETEAAELLAKIATWEAAGAQIDGINIRLHTLCHLDSDELHAYELRIMLLFEALAASGKPVKISDLTVSLVDYDGNAETVTTLSFDEQAVAGAFYNYIVYQYISIFGSNAAGISFGALFEEEGSNKVCLWDADRNRTPSYVGVAEALQGNSRSASDIIKMANAAAETTE